MRAKRGGEEGGGADPYFHVRQGKTTTSVGEDGILGREELDRSSSDAPGSECKARLFGGVWRE
jgi:hypothetical protein